jgi:hypothetical protein
MTASTSPTSPSSPQPARRPKQGRLPVLFAQDTQLFGWQGLTATLPHDWFMRSFGGSHTKGNLRIVDDEGLRLELLWEQPKVAPDVQSSIDRFLTGLEKEAKKKKQEFRVADHPNLVTKKGAQRTQLVNFGWIGEKGDPVASQGWGVAWECAHCDRIVVAHVVGRGNEASSKVQQLASEVLSTLDCHGNGGWETWSVFGFRLEVPEEFKLGRAKLLAGRLDLEWLRTPPTTLLPVPTWAKNNERIAVQRVSAANVVLERESIADWIQRTLTRIDKKRAWNKPEVASTRGHDGIECRGRPRDLRQRLWTLAQHKVRKKAPPSIELRAWECTQSNKIFVLDTHLSAANAHVCNDVLDSLECH